jgi:hypothetical protein
MPISSGEGRTLQAWAAFSGKMQQDARLKGPPLMEVITHVATYLAFVNPIR